MAKIYGKEGSFTWGSSGIANVKAWALDENADIHDDTDFTDAATGAKSKGAGLTEWSGQADATIDDTTAPLRAGVSATVTLTAKTSKTYSGTAIIQSVNLKSAAEGKPTEYTIKFVGDGALTQSWGT